MNESIRSWANNYSETDVQAAHEELLNKIGAQSVRMNENISHYNRQSQFNKEHNYYVKDQFLSQHHKKAISTARSFEVNEGKFHPKVDFRKRKIHNPRGENWAVNKTMDYLDNDYQVRASRQDRGIKPFNPNGYFVSSRGYNKDGFGGKSKETDRSSFNENSYDQSEPMMSGTGGHDQILQNNQADLMSAENTKNKKLWAKNRHREHIPCIDNLFHCTKLISNAQSIYLDNRDIDVNHFCNDAEGKSR